MARNNVKTFKVRSMLLGPYGFMIYEGVYRFPDRWTKEGLQELIPLSKVSFNRGYIRYNGLSEVFQNVRDGNNKMKLLIQYLADSLDKGSWEKSEIGTCDWGMIFNHFEDDPFHIGEIKVKIVGLAVFNGRVKVTINNKFILTPNKRLAQQKSDPFVVFEHQIGDSYDEPEVITKVDKKIMRATGGKPKEISKWKANHMIDYVYDMVSEKKGQNYISKAEIKRKSILKCGVDVLGKFLSIKDRSMAKEPYTRFIDWVVSDFFHADNITASNFVSQPTMRAYMGYIKKQKETGTLRINHDADYKEGSEVSF